MSKKNANKKKVFLSNILLIIGVIAMISIAFSKSIICTLLILVVTLVILFLISKKMNKLNKNN